MSQVQKSTAETPGLDTPKLNLFLSRYDVALTCACRFFPCGATGLVCGRMKLSTTVRVRRIEEEEEPCLCPRRSATLSTRPWSRWNWPRASMGFIWNRDAGCAGPTPCAERSTRCRQWDPLRGHLRARAADNAELDDRMDHPRLDQDPLRAAFSSPKRRQATYRDIPNAGLGSAASTSSRVWPPRSRPSRSSRRSRSEMMRTLSTRRPGSM